MEDKSSKGETNNHQSFTQTTARDNYGHTIACNWSNVNATVNVNISDNNKLITEEDKDRMFQDQVKLYRNQILNTDNNTSLRTKLDQLNIAGRKCHVERKFIIEGRIEGLFTKLTSDEFLKNLPRSKTSLVSAPSGSGKSTIAASITEQWAKSEDSSYDLVLFLSSLHTAEKSALQRMVWGEYTSTMREESKFIYQEMEERKGKILIIIDGLGNDILGYKLRSNQLICL